MTGIKLFQRSWGSCASLLTTALRVFHEFYGSSQTGYAKKPTQAKVKALPVLLKICNCKVNVNIAVIITIHCEYDENKADL